MAEKPVLKLGVLGDVQGLPARHDWGMNNFSRALDILKEKGVDVLLSLGDIAEGGDPDTYALYWEMIEERFGKGGIRHFACEGNHDLGNGHRPDFSAIFRQVCAGLRRPDKFICHEKISGYDFIAASETACGVYSHEVCAELAGKLASLPREKPVFVLTHYPPYGTMAGSFDDKAGIRPLREVLDRFPQVISLSGHTHWPLEDERCIWQGRFTAVTASSLSYGCMNERCFNSVGGIIPFAREAVQLLYMELFPDRLEIERVQVLDRSPAGERWRVRLPYRPEEAFYTDARPGSGSAPRFPAGARLLTRYDYGYMYLAFERTEEGVPALYYDVELVPLFPGGMPETHRYVGDFYRLKACRGPRIFLRLPGRGMRAGADYRIRVYPVSAFGVRGGPLEIVEHTWPGYPFKDGTPLCPQE
ncbi:MAG: metallophosphoesterase [Lentisphaeria bacterium]|nr:metallophosphoesterase [Lentisphaeria bacterium]